MTSEWGNDTEFWARLLLDTEPDVTEVVRDEMLDVAFSSDHVPADDPADDGDPADDVDGDDDLVSDHDGEHHDPTDHHHDVDTDHDDPHSSEWGWS